MAKLSKGDTGERNKVRRSELQNQPNAIVLSPIKRVAAVPRSTVSYLAHFLLMGLGVDRLYGCTVTIFGPGFFSVRCGRQTALFAISLSPFRGLIAAACRQEASGRRKRTAANRNRFPIRYPESNLLRQRIKRAA
jgi:hypothetical protein